MSNKRRNKKTRACQSQIKGMHADRLTQTIWCPSRHRCLTAITTYCNWAAFATVAKDSKKETSRFLPMKGQLTDGSNLEDTFGTVNDPWRFTTARRVEPLLEVPASILRTEKDSRMDRRTETAERKEAHFL